MQLFWKAFLLFTLFSPSLESSTSLKISILKLDQQISFTKRKIFEISKFRSILFSFSCIRLDARSNIQDFGINFYNNPADLVLNQSIWNGLFEKAKRIFTGMKHKDQPVLKRYCLSPYETAYVEMIPSSNHQTLWISTKFQGLDYSCLLLLCIGCLLFFNAKNLSNSDYFYYSSGTSIGILSSLLILVFIFGRLVPGRKSVFYSILIGGWSLCGVLFSKIKSDLINMLTNHYYLVASYILITGFIGFGFSYVYAGSRSQRVSSLIQWMLQIIGVILIYNGTHTTQMSLTILGCVVFYHLIVEFKIPKKNVDKTESFSNVTYKSPSKFTNLVNKLSSSFYRTPEQHSYFMTEDEYREQGVIETRKALALLRKYCNSPKCSPWKTLNTLKSPQKFSKFIEGSDHVTEEERDLHENEIYLDSSDEDLNNTSHLLPFSPKPSSWADTSWEQEIKITSSGQYDDFRLDYNEFLTDDEDFLTEHEMKS